MQQYVAIRKQIKIDLVMSIKSCPNTASRQAASEQKKMNKKTEK